MLLEIYKAMPLFSDITRDHLLKAISQIDSDGIPSGGESRYYDVLHEGKTYPPKLIVSYAYGLIHGEPLDRNSFRGGSNTDCFKLLEKNGFEIVKKNNSRYPNIWFVAQGTTFPEPGSKYLWAPKKNKNGHEIIFWKNMERVSKGDIIFHHATALKGVSVAVSDAYDSVNPANDNPWEREGTKVDIHFSPFTPAINRRVLVENKDQLITALHNITNKPFNIEGKINQGYLYEFSKEAGQIIRKLYGKPFGNEDIEDFFMNDIEVTTYSNNGNNKLNQEMSILQIVSHANKYIESKGFHFNLADISNFYLSLKTKPFVILAGVSGTGKTQLPRKFAEALGMGKEQLIQIPVRPDWTDGSDLLGYTGLDGQFKPKALSEAIKTAMEEGNRDKPFFFILDEMNLARVEHYFSDFLSIIETRQWDGEGKIVTDPIIRKETLDNALNKEAYEDFHWPENLYLIGTVNMDETTHAFSRKVLDRANSIEMNDIDLDWTTPNGQKTEPLQGVANSFFKTEYLHSIDLSEAEKKDFEKELELLKKVNAILQEADLHFAYRVRDEIAFYLIANKRFGLLSGLNEAMDFQLMQKVLPRIHGSSERIQKVLVKLYNLLEGTDYSHHQVPLEVLEKTNQEDLKYKRSSKKIVFMLKRYEDDRFTSFWL
jgi:energy-coupling factor transporter ATP-binding protein EcfA2